MWSNHRWTVGLLVALTLALSAGCTEKYIVLTEKGDKAFEQGNYELATRRYEAALEHYAKYAPALVRLGEIATMNQDWKQARDIFSRTIEADPMMVKAYLGRGVAELHLFEYEAAGRDFKKAKELGSSRADLGLGIYYYLTDRFDAAFAALRYATQQPEDADVAIRYVFKTALDTGDYATGLEVLQGAAVSDDEATRTLWRRMQAELTLLTGDVAGANHLAMGLKDLPPFGIWYREPSPQALAQMSPFKGAVVEYVHFGSPAWRAGMQPGDLITSFDLKPVQSAAALEAAIHAYLSQAGRDEALFEALRGNQQLAFRILPHGYQWTGALEDLGETPLRERLRMAPKSWMEFP